MQPVRIKARPARCSLELVLLPLSGLSFWTDSTMRRLQQLSRRSADSADVSELSCTGWRPTEPPVSVCILNSSNPVSTTASLLNSMTINSTHFYFAVIFLNRCFTIKAFQKLQLHNLLLTGFYCDTCTGSVGCSAASQPITARHTCSIRHFILFCLFHVSLFWKWKILK